MNKLFNLRTAFFLALSLIFGISFGYFLLVNSPIFAILSVLALGFLSLSLFFFVGKLDKAIKIFLSCLFILIFSFGAFSFTIKTNNYKNANLGSHYYSVRGTIDSISDYNGSNLVIIKDVSVVGNVNKKLDYKVKLNVFNTFKDCFNVGDIIAFNANLDDFSLKYNGKFSFYNIYSKIKYHASVDYLDVAITGRYLNLFDRINSAIKKTLRVGLADNEFSVASALLLGDTDAFNDELLDDFRALGVAHIFAVSGLHIGFLLAVLTFIFKKIKLNKKLSVILTIILLFTYSGVCGFSASSLRACIMSSCYLLTKAFSKKYDALSSVSFSAFLILFFSPFSLFSVGFILSFISVIGIVLLSRIFTRAFSKLPYKIASSLSVSLSAFIVSTPMVCVYFKTLSVFSVLFNIILIPIVSILFFLLIFCTILALIFGANGVFLFVPSIFIKGLVFCVSAIKIKAITLDNFSFGLYLAFYYLAVLFISELINAKKRLRFICALISICLCISSFMLSINTSLNGYYVYAHATNNFAVVVTSHAGEHSAILVGNFDSGNNFVLDRIIDNLNISEFENLIVVKNSNAKFNAIYNVVRLVSVKNAFVYGELPSNYKMLFDNYFSTCVNNLDDGKSLTINGLSFRFDCEGNAVELLFNNKTILLFDSLDSNYTGYSCFNANPNLLFFFNYGERLTSLYQPKDAVSLKKSLIFTDAESTGIIKYNFNN